jgi:benzoyl-CoA reductase/2-hydroxyglutaryl-CoA dehydratase subunit BcrC/BadD/HgdB
MHKIGITTTIPSEVLWAAGQVPLDLNNLFIASPQKLKLVEEAEVRGFPRNTCSWIKGIYAVARRSGIKRVIAVTRGDCSNTQALMEVFQSERIEVIPFAYPYNRDHDLLKLQIEKLIDELGTNWEAVNRMKTRLDERRRKVHYIDRMTWEENLVSGRENHLFLVSCSDMQGNISQFEQQVDQFIQRLETRSPKPQKVRLGFIGVPPIYPELYDYLEEIGARVVFNETQRQFAMPHFTSDLVEQYRLYTYPYAVFERLKDIKQQVKLRHITGLIHYVQSFCFRQIEDILIRQQLDIPILTLEGDRPSPLDARTKLRLESFVESLAARNA